MFRKLVSSSFDLICVLHIFLTYVYICISYRCLYMDDLYSTYIQFVSKCLETCIEIQQWSDFCSVSTSNSKHATKSLSFSTVLEYEHLLKHWPKV